MKITHLKANHLVNPIGYCLENLSLSWITENTLAKRQTVARIVIAKNSAMKDVFYDSGKRTDVSSLSFHPDIELDASTRYYWQVEVWADNGDYCKSGQAYFETGKLTRPWSAKWIVPNLDKDVHPYMRRSFQLEKQVRSARAYVCGLGLYELEINGQKVGNEYLMPGNHSYDLWLQYQTYDVTDCLQQGENAVGAMLGNGWYKGRLGFRPNQREWYGDTFAFLMELHVTFADGQEAVINTDNSWKCFKSPVQLSEIYDGEIYDANEAVLNWSSKGCDESGWIDVKAFEVNVFPPKTGPLAERLSPPVTIRETLQPVKLIRTPSGKNVLDFGQNMAGWVTCKVNLPKGSKLQLRYGEILQNEEFYNENLRTAKQEFIYISDGVSATVRPHFTYYGFRYVEVTGVESVLLEDYTACVLLSEMEQLGTIETSNSEVNRLFLNALWGQKGNFIDVPTDCPQRDERLGWTGDAQIFSGTACFNMDTTAFYTKYMKDLYLEEKLHDGGVPYIIPDIKRDDGEGLGLKYGSCAWGDAAVVIPWNVYLFSGDLSLLERQYPAMQDWIHYILAQDHADGDKRLWQTDFHFADWLALDNPDKDSPLGGTDPYFIASAYYCYSTRLTAMAAEKLGKEKDAAFYYNLVDEIKQAIGNTYFTEDGKIKIQTQTAMVVSLFMDLVPEDWKPGLIQALKEKLEKNNLHLDTGFVGTPYLCRTLSENDCNAYAYHLLLNPDYPGWLYEVKMGATTIWERWNSVLPDGNISDTGMNSLNHYAYGSVVEWMYRNVCGINPMPDHAGFKKIDLKPQPDKQLRYAKVVYLSAAGSYESGWEYGADGRLQYDFSIPFDCEAVLTVQKEALDVETVKTQIPHNSIEETDKYLKFKLDAGKYHFG